MHHAHDTLWGKTNWLWQQKIKLWEWLEQQTMKFIENVVKFIYKKENVRMCIYHSIPCEIVKVNVSWIFSSCDEKVFWVYMLFFFYIKTSKLFDR